MRLDDWGERRPTQGPFSKIAPQWLLAGAIGYVILVACTPLAWRRVIMGEACVLAFAIGLSGLSAGTLLRRWAAFSPLVAFFAITAAFGRPERLELGLAVVIPTLLVKNSLAFLAIMIPAGVLPFPRFLAGLRGLGMPALLVSALRFMARQLAILADELDRMIQARRARTFRRSQWRDWSSLAGMIGALFVRSLERGERVHAAMLARGYDGEADARD